MTAPLPVIFIHGLRLHSTSWQPWIDLFRDEGYDPSAPGWPGDPDTVEEARQNPESIAGHGIDDVVEHYAALIADLPVRPVVIGHSFGGMIAQKLLGQDRAAAAVAIDAAQIKGVLPLPLSALRATFPVFKNPANKHRVGLADRGAVPVRVRQRPLGGGADGPVRTLGHPGAGQAAVRGRLRQLQPALAREGRHAEQRTRSAAADLRRQGPHGSGTSVRTGTATEGAGSGPLGCPG
ncbi:alpha/beta hydrolase [Streptomyces griseorubiginosus]|uniref:alpha/beta hydrolase n=1 Tax=Streptomyces griseorubiginosus TaxID=67304 RepID=UPI0036EF4D73